MRAATALAVAVVLVSSAGCERQESGISAPADGSRLESAPPARADTVGGPDHAVVFEFERRVQEYMTLQNQLADTLSDVPGEATPMQIDANQRALAALVAKARADTKPGAVFSPEMQKYVRGVIRRVLDGPDGMQLRASITDENPVGTPIQINGRYPDAVPMSTMPPDILAALPQLPEQLQYRFVGDRLILLDTEAHIIVDYVDNALPA